MDSGRGGDSNAPSRFGDRRAWSAATKTGDDSVALSFLVFANGTLDAAASFLGDAFAVDGGAADGLADGLTGLAGGDIAGAARLVGCAGFHMKGEVEG